MDFNPFLKPYCHSFFILKGIIGMEETCDSEFNVKNNFNPLNTK